MLAFGPAGTPAIIFVEPAQPEPLAAYLREGSHIRVRNISAGAWQSNCTNGASSMKNKIRKSPAKRSRRAMVALAGVLASNSADMALAKGQLAADSSPTQTTQELQTPEQIDEAIKQLPPGALRRLLLKLRVEDGTRVAGPAHDTHSATTFGNHSSSPK